MTEGYKEYYLCGDKSLPSLLRDEVFRRCMNFENPPINLIDRMKQLSVILNIDDPYNIMVITDDRGTPITYRVETTEAFKKEHILALEEVGFDFESIISRGESIAIYLIEGGL